MAEGYTIKLSQATFSKSIGKWLERMTPAERHALLGAGIGGTTLAMRRLMSRRDKDHKKRGVLSQALLGALLGGTAGYGLSSAFGGGVKPNAGGKEKSVGGQATEKEKSVGGQAAEKVRPLVAATKEIIGPAAGSAATFGKDVASNVGEFAAGTEGSGAALGGAAGLAWAAKARHSASKLPTELQAWIASLPKDGPTHKAVTSVLGNESRYLRDTKMSPAQRFFHANPRYADWGAKPVGSIRRSVADFDANRILPPKVKRVNQATAYGKAPRWKKWLGLARKPKAVPAAPALVTKGRHVVPGPASGAAQTVESVKRRALNDLGYTGGFSRPGPSKWVYARRGVGSALAGLLAEVAARKGYSAYSGGDDGAGINLRDVYTLDK